MLSAHVEYSVESYFSNKNAGERAGETYTEPTTQIPSPFGSFPCMVVLTSPCDKQATIQENNSVHQEKVISGFSQQELNLSLSDYL